MASNKRSARPAKKAASSTGRRGGRPSNASIQARNDMNWAHQVEIIAQAASGAAAGAVRAAFESGGVTTVGIATPQGPQSQTAGSGTGDGNRTSTRKATSKTASADRRTPGAPRNPDSALSKARAIYDRMVNQKDVQRADIVAAVMKEGNVKRPVANTYIYGIDKANGGKLASLGKTRGTGGRTRGQTKKAA